MPRGGCVAARRTRALPWVVAAMDRTSGFRLTPQLISAHRTPRAPSQSIHDCLPHCSQQGANAVNNRYVFRMLAVVVFVFGIAAFVGIGAYNAGVAHGIAESGRLAVAAPGTAPV